MTIDCVVTSHTHFSIQMKSTLGRMEHNQVVFWKCNKMLIFNFSKIVSVIENTTYPKPSLQSKVTPVDDIKTIDVMRRFTNITRKRGSQTQSCPSLAFTT